MNLPPRQLVVGVCLVLFLFFGHTFANAQAESSKPTGSHLNFNLPTKTLGGKQYWGDERLYGGWRIQQNVLTGHYRLLDKQDVRRAWGTYAQCEQALEEAIATGKATLTSDRLCVLVHGYLRSKDSLGPLKALLEEADYEVYAINYPSMAKSIEELSAQVGRVLGYASKDFNQVHVVSHSLGGILARKLMSASEWECQGKLVMLAPPNQGAVMADAILGWWPSERLVGPAGKQLITGVEGFAATAGTPRCSFGVIAGSLRNGEGLNPLIAGDDDGIVGMEQTKLEGMADFITVNAAHTFIMSNPETHRHVLHFLEHGKFVHTAP